MAHPRTHPARAGFATLTLPILTLLALLSGCTVFDQERDKALATASQPATLTSVSALHADLVNLPPPRGKIVAAVYGFRDQTGQYKPSPDSSFSTAVTQGAGAMLIKSMTDSKWFIPVEREGLQNILTERRIVRALDNTPNGSNLAGLLPASILLEGGIISFESNVRTGGAGARYLGVGASEQYRTDQVTINLRAVDIRSGRIPRKPQCRDGKIPHVIPQPQHAVLHPARSRKPGASHTLFHRPRRRVQANRQFRVAH